MASGSPQFLVLGEDPDLDQVDLLDPTAQVRPDRIAAQYDEDVTILTEIEKSQIHGTEPIVRAKAYRRFRYSPLQSPKNFRLLRLSSSNGIDSMHATLEETSLDNAEPFYALSYTWGQGDPKHPLLLGDYIIHIRENLYQALRRAPLMGVEIIWIDAICINQEDFGERASQVMLMRQIYNGSRCVLIDLGGSHSQNPGLQNFLTNITNISSFHPPTNGIVDYTQLNWDRLEQYGLPKFKDPLWHSLNDLLERPWFTRVWVTQEFASAKNAAIVCNGWVMELNDFLPIFKNMYLYGLFGHPDISADAEAALYRLIFMITLNQELVHLDRFRPLIYLLEGNRFSQATNPRDHIYGLLGISKESDEPALTPDYGEELCDLYVRTAKYFALHHAYVPALLHNAGIRTAGQDLPSWVPRWDSPLYSQVIPTDILSDGRSVFRASGQTDCVARLADHGLILKVRGMTFDEISLVGVPPAAWESLRVDERTDSYIQEAISMLRDHGSAYPTGEMVSQVIWRLLLCDQVPGLLLRAPEGLSRSVEAMIMLCAQTTAYKRNDNVYWNEVGELIARWLETGGLQHDQAGIWEMVAESKKVFVGINKHLNTARRSMTRKGYICQVPPEVQQGDVIAIFHGCDVPFVLRPSTRNRYQLIGNCYVHGIMDGEALSHDNISAREIELV